MSKAIENGFRKIIMEDNVFDLDERRKYAIPKLDGQEPPSGDWLSPLTSGTEFKCRDKTGRTPRWLVQEFTHCGKLKGDVLLSPTVSLNNPQTWFWVEPIEFCKQWEFRGVIEQPDIDVSQTERKDDGNPKEDR